MAPELVIFDLDGTLVDSRADITTAVNRTLAELGERGHPPEAIREWIGDGVTRLLERALGHPERVAQARGLFDRLYSGGLLDETRPYPGVNRLLQSLTGRFLLAVATNKPGEMARAIVRGLGWGEAIGAVIGAREGADLKPAPDMLERLLEQTGRSSRDAVMVGDMVVDLTAARAAGIEFVGVAWGYGQGRELEAAGARIVVEDTDELRAVLALRASS